MSRGLPVLLACAAAAGCDRQPDRITIATPGARAPERVVPGTPHGAGVSLVAVTEAGDAAVTADQLGTVRLWPALDGTRQAIPIATIVPRALVLGVAGDELVAAIIDQAHLAHVLRLRRDGTVLARTDLPADVAARQIIAVGGDVLVRRADEAIERYDARGVMHGRIVAQPGERIGTLATRGGAAIATIVAGEAQGAGAVRWIELGDELRWGGELALPVPIEPSMLALSPGRKRLAAGTVATAAGAPSSLAIYNLGATVTPYAMPGRPVVPGAVFGFTDDDDVAIVDRDVLWWTAVTRDPWADSGTPSEPSNVHVIGAAGIGDGIAVVGYSAGLELATPSRTRYLGWTQLAFGDTWVVGDVVAQGLANDRIAVYDADLAQLHSVQSLALHTRAPHSIALVDERHVAIASVADNDRTIVEIVDIAHPAARFTVPTVAAVGRLEYEPAVGVLAMATEQGIERARIDLAHATATRLSRLAFIGTVFQIRLLDPARADGIVAVVDGQDATAEHVHVFREATHHADHATVNTDTVIALGPTGTVYERLADHRDTVVARRDGRELGRFELDHITNAAATSHDGETLAFVRIEDITLVDTRGAIRWHHPVWNAASVAFTGDDRRIVVRTTTGLVVLDAATGHELARACGWGFGLHDAPLPAMVYGQAPVCEDGGP